MADLPVSFEQIRYRRVFPWLHLTRAFWIATDLRKLFLAAIALLLTSIGAVAVDQLPFGQPHSNFDLAHPQGERWPWDVSLGYVPVDDEAVNPIENMLTKPRTTLLRASENWQIVLLPIRDFLGRAPVFLRRQATLSELADAATRMLWNLIVWSVFGGAICRIAAVQFARDQQIGMRQALTFSLSKFFGYFSAPLLPLAGVA
ncbi:MAG: hypothetical protein JSS02_07500, partial [Planctomycetes bacterium]|nr:hypothetical protein [Planctomycetota bacterium]